MVKFVPQQTAVRFFVQKNTLVTLTVAKFTLLENLEKDPIYLNSLDLDFAAWMSGSNDASAFWSIQYVPDGDVSIAPDTAHEEVVKINRILDSWNVGLGATSSGATAFMRRIIVKQIRKLNLNDKIEVQVIGGITTNIIKFSLVGKVNYSSAIKMIRSRRRKS